MPRRRFILILAVLGGLSAAAQDPFSIDKVLPAPLTAATSEPFLEVRIKGTAPRDAVLKDPHNWVVVFTTKAGASAPITAFTVDVSKNIVTLRFTGLDMAGRDPQKLGWNVSFTGAPVPVSQSFSPTSKPGRLKAAKAKDDADIYLFGSYLAGFSTKPLYTIDAKVNWQFADKNDWAFGVQSALSSNTSATPPAARTTVDPDSVTASFTLTHVCGNCLGTGTKFDIRPIAGEFSRKYPASSILTKGYATLILIPKDVGKSWKAMLYPSAGYEIGKNLNQPNMLFKQPVDLSRWNAIARAAFITTFEFYHEKKVTKEGETPYNLTLDATYQPRVPFTYEPFVTSEYVGGKLVAVTRMTRNTRHEVEAAANWNINKYLGIRLQYKYGALPPLFQFVDHQGSIGITFKAVQADKK